MGAHISLLNYSSTPNRNTKEKWDEVLKELKQQNRYKIENDLNDNMEDWILIQSNEPVDENELSTFQQRRTTLAWFSKKMTDPAVSFISYLWSSSSTSQNEVEARINELVSKIKQLEGFQEQLMKQPSSVNQSQIYPVLQLQENTEENPSISLEESTSEVTWDISAIPPPPPPPNQISVVKSNLQISIGSVPLKRFPKTRDQIRAEIKSLLEKSDVFPENHDVVTKNFMEAFDKKLQVLERIVYEYPVLVYKLALYPKVAYKRFLIWENHLFKDLDIKKASEIRKKKLFEIGKLSQEVEILSEIERIKVMIEAQKKKEKQEEEQKKRDQTLGSIVNELKQIHKQKETEERSTLIKQQLSQMEIGQIDSEDEEEIKTIDSNNIIEEISLDQENEPTKKSITTPQESILKEEEEECEEIDPDQFE